MQTEDFNLRKAGGRPRLSDMVRKFLGLLVVAFLPCMPLVRATTDSQPLTHIDDPGRLAVCDSHWASGMEAKLASFETSTRIRIVLQFHLKSPPADEDKKPGAYMSGLATKLGIIKGGVLVVFFADDPDWRVWVGDALTPKFVGRLGSAKEFTESGAMHEAKEAFLSRSLAEADTAFSAIKKALSTGGSLTPGKQLTLQADALIDGLRSKLGPK